TDVIEDADGSLIVLDTGGWYKLCCPTSQLNKPDVLGAIYRIRKVGAKKLDDARGLKIAWAKLNPDALAGLLGDERVFVQRRVMAELARRREAAVPVLADIIGSNPKPKGRADNSGLSSAPPGGPNIRVSQDDWPKGLARREKALWTLARIGSPAARAAIRLGLNDSDSKVRCASLQSASLLRDSEAVSKAEPDGILPQETRLWF